MSCRYIIVGVDSFWTYEGYRRFKKKRIPIQGEFLPSEERIKRMCERFKDKARRRSGLHYN